MNKNKKTKYISKGRKTEYFIVFIVIKCFKILYNKKDLNPYYCKESKYKLSKGRTTK